MTKYRYKFTYANSAGPWSRLFDHRATALAEAYLRATREPDLHSIVIGKGPPEVFQVPEPDPYDDESFEGEF